MASERKKPYEPMAVRPPMIWCHVCAINGFEVCNFQNEEPCRSCKNFNQQENAKPAEQRKPLRVCQPAAPGAWPRAWQQKAMEKRLLKTDAAQLGNIGRVLTRPIAAATQQPTSAATAPNQAAQVPPHRATRDAGQNAGPPLFGAPYAMPALRGDQAPPHLAPALVRDQARSYDHAPAPSFRQPPAAPVLGFGYTSPALPGQAFPVPPSAQAQAQALGYSNGNGNGYLQPEPAYHPQWQQQPHAYPYSSQTWQANPHQYGFGPPPPPSQWHQLPPLPNYGQYQPTYAQMPSTAPPPMMPVSNVKEMVERELRQFAMEQKVEALEKQLAVRMQTVQRQEPTKQMQETDTRHQSSMNMANADDSNASPDSAAPARNNSRKHRRDRSDDDAGNRASKRSAVKDPRNMNASDIHVPENVFFRGAANRTRGPNATRQDEAQQADGSDPGHSTFWESSTRASSAPRGRSSVRSDSHDAYGGTVRGRGSQAASTATADPSSSSTPAELTSSDSQLPAHESPLCIKREGDESSAPIKKEVQDKSRAPHIKNEEHDEE